MCRTAVVMLCVSSGALLSFAWYLHRSLAVLLLLPFFPQASPDVDSPAQHPGTLGRYEKM